MNRRGFLTAAGGAGIAGLLLACGLGGEAEDCDEDDRREGDDDCDTDGLKPKKRKTKPKTKPRSRR